MKKNRRKLEDSVVAYVLMEQKTAADEHTMVTFEEGLSANMFSVFDFLNE